MNPKNVSAVIVTRGNLTQAQMDEVMEPLQCFGEVLIWDNLRRAWDYGPYGAYMAVKEAQNPLIYFQDDDCVVSSPEALLHSWQPNHIVCNMAPEFQQAYARKPDVLIGFGSVFPKSLVQPTFARYFTHYKLDAVTMREPNRIFTALNRKNIITVHVPVRNMPYASDPTRLWKQPDHGIMRDESYRRVVELLEREKRA